MEANEIKNTHGGRSLGESMDLLREHMEELNEHVHELYVLDDDNWQTIGKLVDKTTTLQKKLDGLSHQVRRNRGRVALGCISLAGLAWLGSKAIDHLNQRIKALEEQKTEKDPEKAEESDG